MQRLEVSGAVRPIYGSFGLKRLINQEFSRHILEKYSNTKFFENPFSGRRVFQYGRNDMQTDRHEPRQ